MRAHLRVDSRLLSASQLRTYRKVHKLLQFTTAPAAVSGDQLLNFHILTRSDEPGIRNRTHAENLVEKFDLLTETLSGTEVRIIYAVWLKL